MLNNEGQAATFTSPVPSNNRTASANSAYVDVREYEGDLVFTLDVGTVTGTTPTLDVKIQDNATGSGGGTDITGAAFTQVTASTNAQKLTVPAGSVLGWIRVAYTIAGTSPNFNFSVGMLGRKKIV